MTDHSKNIDKINEVSIGRILMPGYCPELQCLQLNGYIDFGAEGKLVYLDCTCEDQKANECILLRALLGHSHDDGTKVIGHRRGSKGQIMDDILDWFNRSRVREIRIPIISNPDDSKTHPAGMKRAFVILKDIYDTQLEPHVIEKIKNDEFIDRYVLTIKKMGEPEEKALKEKVLDPLKAFGAFFSRRGD